MPDAWGECTPSSEEWPYPLRSDKHKSLDDQVAKLGKREQDNWANYAASALVHMAFVSEQ